MKAAALTPELLKAVMDDLWEVSAHELAVFGEITDLMTTQLKMAIVDDDGKPVCVFGANNGSSGMRTWFLASSSFPHHAHAVTRMLRRLLIEQSKEHNVRKIVTTSASDHPMAKNWFRLLGYRPDGVTDWKNGVAQRYVLEL